MTKEESKYFVYPFQSNVLDGNLDRFKPLLDMVNLNVDAVLNYTVAAGQRHIEHNIDPADTIADMMACDVDTAIPEPLSDQIIHDFDDMFEWMGRVTEEIEPLIRRTMSITNGGHCISFLAYKPSIQAIALEIL